MKSVNIIFPHQLFKSSPLFENEAPFYIVEEDLFFNQYAFHKQKIAFHRATMKFYADYLEEKNFVVKYINAHESTSDVRLLISDLKKDNVHHINYIDPTDNWLEKRINDSLQKNGIQSTKHNSSLFLNSNEELNDFFNQYKTKFNQTSFYIDQRKKRNILLDEQGKPMGGQWTFDTENRKKYPSKKLPPSIQFPETDHYYREAIEYVDKYYSKNPGNLSNYPLYPLNFESSETWLNLFFEQRFMEYGTYQDAIKSDNSILHHSIISPMINVGMLTPQYVLQSAKDYAKTHQVPINSTEGFIRQILGWREFVRGVYQAKGSYERTKNFWGFKNKIPASFYTGTTGIQPIDQTIRKILKTGYCNHIERLMVLGNFMVLCEFDPDEVYQWFMELFIDAYDWVMVTNVYGMSQFADGGLMASKPYISGSNYILKMSDYKKGDWQIIWDGLFWRFISQHRDYFSSNPRLNMMVNLLDKMPEDKKQRHFSAAQKYLSDIES